MTEATFNNAIPAFLHVVSINGEIYRLTCVLIRMMLQGRLRTVSVSEEGITFRGGRDVLKVEFSIFFLWTLLMENLLTLQVYKDDLVITIKEKSAADISKLFHTILTTIY